MAFLVAAIAEPVTVIVGAVLFFVAGEVQLAAKPANVGADEQGGRDSAEMERASHNAAATVYLVGVEPGLV